MQRKVNLNIILLGLVIVLALFIGSLLGGKTIVEDNSSKHKYDSLERVITNQEQIMETTRTERDSARAELSIVREKRDAIEKQLAAQKKIHAQEKINLRKKLIAMSADDLARKAREVYDEAYPVPLFEEDDTTKVITEKIVVVHLLEQDQEAKHLKVSTEALHKTVELQNIEISNLSAQLTSYQVDSAANKAIIHSLRTSNLLKDEDLIKQEQRHRRELRRQKWKTAGATVIAVAITVAAIAL